MNEEDPLLDNIVARLRTELIPEMPAALARRDPVILPRRRRYMLAACGLAATVVVAIFSYSNFTPPIDPHSAPESAISVEAIDLAEPLTQLAQKLDSIDADIAALRTQAALLDARRSAEALFAQHQQAFSVDQGH